MSNVINKNAGLLTNYEVYEFLSRQRDERKEHDVPNRSDAPAVERKKDPDNLLIVEAQVLEFLEKTPAVHQSTEQITSFLQQLEGSNLTKAEKLQLIDLRPRTLVEIHLIVEQCDERLTEDQTIQLLSIVNDCFPLPAPPPEEAAAEGDEAEAGGEAEAAEGGDAMAEGE
eukprot:tig00000219_g19461.t1